MRRSLVLFSLMSGMSGLIGLFVPLGDAVAQTLPDKFLFNGGEVTLSADCASITSHVEAFREWKKKFKEVPPAFDPKTIHHKLLGGCSVRIDPFLPRIVARMNDQVAGHDGPNCFNAALVLSGILPEFRYTDGEEVAFWLDSPLCRKLHKAEARLPGDFLLISEPLPSGRQKVIHGFVYIDDQFVFSKNGLSKKAPFAVQEMEDVKNVYSVDDKKVVLDAYRCTNFDEFVKDTYGSLSIDYRAMSNSVREVECNIGHASLQDGLFDPAAVAHALASIEIMIALIKSNLDTHPDGTPTTQGERTLWLGLEHQLESMTVQLKSFP